MAAFWLRNLMAYAAQIAILALSGGLALRLLRMRIPKIRLLCWQTLLAAALHSFQRAGRGMAPH
jgi:hypothetical protein